MGFRLQEKSAQLCDCHGCKLTPRGPSKSVDLELTSKTQVFGNSNSLPISLVLSLSHTISGLHWDKVPGDNDYEVGARGILYLLIFQQLGQLVRWSWGYNVLLAPPDQVIGEDENTRSRLEQGQYGEINAEEEQRLLDDTSLHDDDETRIASTDIEGQAKETREPGKGSAIGCYSDQGYASGDQTPSTRKPYTSSGSSTLSSPVLAQPFDNNLATPANGNIKPSNNDNFMNKLPSMGSDTASIAEGASEGIRGLPVRVKSALRRALRTVSKGTSSTFTAAFRSLPRPLQTGLARIGHGLRRFFGGVWEFMNPPLWAMLVAIIVASVPPLQRLFFTPGTFIENSVTSAIRQSGGVAVPLILVVLGANLARNTLPVDPNHTREDDKEETRILIASLVSRMLLPTVIMAPILALAAKYVPVSILDDPIFIIVCFLLTGAPSALQLAQICQINNVYVGAMTRLLFQSYVIWFVVPCSNITGEALTYLQDPALNARPGHVCSRSRRMGGRCVVRASLCCDSAYVDLSAALRSPCALCTLAEAVTLYSIATVAGPGNVDYQRRGLVTPKAPLEVWKTWVLFRIRLQLSQKALRHSHRRSTGMGGTLPRSLKKTGHVFYGR